MENLLNCLINDCRAMGNGTNLNCKAIQELSKEALALLETQTSLLQTAPYELREKCFATMRAAMVSNSGHLVRLGIIGCHKLLRDNHLISTSCDPNDDSFWLASQLLKTLKCRSWVKASEDVQIELCKVLLSFSCLDHQYYKMNARILVDLLTFCVEMVLDQLGSPSKFRRLQIAARNAALKNIQIFTSYQCSQKELGEIVPIIQFLCDKLQDAFPETQRLFIQEFCLECFFNVLKELQGRTQNCSRMHNVIWRKLCPVLTELIGIPESRSVTSVHHITEIRLISGIGCQLLNLFGSISALRAPIESLFHRILVVSNRSQRCEAFKALKEVFQNPRHVVSMAGPFLVESPDILASLPADLGLLRILFDGMEESVQLEDLQLRFIILELVQALLQSLLTLTVLPSADHLPDDYTNKINSLYPDISSADYIGLLSLPSKLRMPKSYEQLLEDRRVVLMKLQEVKTEGFSGTDITEDDAEDLHSTTSGITEGPEPYTSVSDDEEDVELQERMKLFPSNAEIMVRADQADIERSAGKQFLKDLQTFLRDLPLKRSPLEVDIALQRFASDYCSGHYSFMYNADGIYLAAYSALLLNYELIQKDFYTEPNGNVPQSEEEFINEVLNSGMLVYLTPEFLSEVYQGILVLNILHEAGLQSGTKFLRTMLSNSALINLLTDIRHLKSSDSATCFLSDCRKLHFASSPNILQNDTRRSAGRKFTRRLLTCIWDSLLSILSAGVSSAERSSVSIALESLESAAKLANSVAMQERCGTIFALLAAVACGSPRISNLSQRKLRKIPVITKKCIIDLDVTHVMSLNVILSKGLELASFNQEAWSHVLRCCLHVADLERQLYKSKTSENSRMATLKQYTSKLTSALSHTQNNEDDLNLSATAFGGLEEENADSYSFLTAASRLPASENEEQLLKDIVDGSGGTLDLLDTTIATRVIASLSDRVASLLEDAAAKLNLQSLLLLLNELCHICRVQLNKTADENVRVQCIWILHRIGEVMMRSVKTGRPLVHALHCWAVIGPTLLHAASNSDPTIGKTAVEILHTVISQVLQEQPEPAHFHFNEALFKPFENLLSFQLCDSDIQDQVTSCLCELVECWSGEIRSGWRSLFACLRQYPHQGNMDSPPEIRATTVQTVKDIFAAFLLHSNSQPLIFANAAQDAILCLLHFVKSSRIPALGILALDYLDQCAGLLIKLIQSSDNPVFHSALRLHFTVSEPLYEPPQIELHHNEQGFWEKSVKELYSVGGQIDPNILDSCEGLLKVLYLLIEGVGCSLTFESHHQKNACQVVMATVERLVEAGREDFANLCLGSVIIPTMLSWLEQVSAESCANFKLSCGLLCDAATKIKQPQQRESVFSQLFILFVQCAVQPNELIARIGNSCLRHLAVFCTENHDTIQKDIWRKLLSALMIVTLFNISHLQQKLLITKDDSKSLAALLLSLQLCLNTTGVLVLQANSVLPRARDVLRNLLLVETSAANLTFDGYDGENMVAAICRLCSEFAIDAEFALATEMENEMHHSGMANDLFPKLRGLTLLSCSLYLICCLNSLKDETMLKDWLEFLVQFYSESSEKFPLETSIVKTPLDLFQFDLSKELLLLALSLLESATETCPVVCVESIQNFLKDLSTKNDDALSGHVSVLKNLYRCA